MKMKFLVLLLTIFLYSCGSTVIVDYDNNTNFSEYNTFDFYPSIDSGLSELDNKRIMYALDSLMLSNGFQKSESPDLLINFFTKEVLTNSRNTIGIGVGSGGVNGGFGVSGGIPIGGNEIEQQFTLDFIDAKEDALIWQGVLNGRYKERATPAQKERYYYTIIQKILKKYPTIKK